MTPEQRFDAKVDRSAGLFGCWLWTGAVTGRGYGSFNHNGAHRFALERALGRPLLPRMHACHDCPTGDNPLCVNPSHLFEGTAAQNNADRHAKGRDATGDRNGARVHRERMTRGDAHPARRIPGFRAGVRNGRARLTEDDVRAIRRLLAAKTPWLAIATAFDISKPAVSHIAAKRTWQHVA